MSEYTDYYAVRVADPAELVAQLAAAGADAVVFDNLVDTAERPAWVAVALFTDETVLARIGPAIHIRLDEDGCSWQLGAITDAGATRYTFFGRPFSADNPPDGFYPVAPRALDEGDAELLAGLLGVPAAQLLPTLAAGGFEAFSGLTGVPYFEMLDQYIRIPQPQGAVSATSLAD